jgi:phytoene/squalene synthetase
MTFISDTKSPIDSRERSVGKTVLALAVAATIATSLGLLFGTRKGEEVQEDIKDKATEVASKFNKTREQVQGKVKKSFNEVSDDLENAYVEVHSTILTELDARKEKAPLEKSEFDKLIDGAVKEFSKGREWTTEKLKKLSQTLKEDWEEFKV